MTPDTYPGTGPDVNAFEYGPMGGGTQDHKRRPLAATTPR